MQSKMLQEVDLSTKSHYSSRPSAVSKSCLLTSFHLLFTIGHQCRDAHGELREMLQQMIDAPES